MAIILNIETSAAVCSVCLSQGGKPIAYKEDTSINSHARILTTLIDQCIDEAKKSFKEIDAVAVSAGPGSFTGLRIGVSTAKGLCYALKKPLISIPTLKIVYRQMQSKITENPSYCMATVEAKKNSIYFCLFDADGKELTATTYTEALENLQPLLAEFSPLLISGTGSAFFTLLPNNGQIVFLPVQPANAIAMACDAEQKYNASLFESVAYFEPAYHLAFMPKLAKL